MNGHGELIDIFNLEAQEVAKLDTEHFQNFHRVDVTGVEFYEIGRRAKHIERKPVRDGETPSRLGHSAA